METLDRDAAKRLLVYMVRHEAALLERGVTDYEITWSINQASALVGEVADLLDELVTEGRLVARDGLYFPSPMKGPHGAATEHGTSDGPLGDGHP
jgi:hypothetical protein